MTSLYRMITLCVFTLVPLALKAQHIYWNSAPRKGFVYQITNNEAQNLLTLSKPDTIFNGLLHTLIDTFNVDKGWIDRPSKGHFILVRASENKVLCEYTSVFPYEVLLLKEYDALALQVLDLEGNVREDAKVKFKRKRLFLDKESKTYRVENNWFHGENKIVTVEVEGFRSVFNVQKHDVPGWENNYYREDDGPDFYSYMITDKNKYKPNEKVRFKSYALSNSRSPIRKSLEAWLLAPSKSVMVGLVSPHRPGSFVGEFQLHDSLKLVLDRNYTLQLRDKNGRVVGNCNFKYEDYELHRNQLSVELSAVRQFHPASNRITIRATDVNGLMLKDAKASIVVRTETIREIFQPVVALPDTLMFKTMDLNGDSATVVEIPSSLFQKSNTSYHVEVAVTNSENHRMEQSVSAVHLYSQYELRSRFSGDSVIYELLKNDTPIDGVTMKVYRDDEPVAEQQTLPLKEKINPALRQIRFESEIVSRSIQMSHYSPRIDLSGGIQKDSFNIEMKNPHKLEASWYIYQGSELLKKGFGNEFEYKSKITNREQTYYVELLYSFGGEDHIQRKEYEFNEGHLNVSMDLPDRVYPGQKVETTIQVNDGTGSPVSNVDLTALATTAKLNYFLPDLPYYGSTSLPREDRAHYSQSPINKRTAVLQLPYKKWEKQLRLDTMKYYQFTYPGNKFFIHKTAIEDSTQFAPYVMKNGAAKHIYVIEVNHVPVYYSWTDQPRAYSFYVEPNRMKEVTLRLHDRVLILKDVIFDAGKKTILSLDLDNLPKSVQTVMIAPIAKKLTKRRKMTYWGFTSTETGRYASYLAGFRVTGRRPFLEMGRHFVPLFNGVSIGETYVVAGPIVPGMQNYRNDTNMKATTFKFQGGYVYAFEDNIVYKTDVRSPLLPDVLSDQQYQPMHSINDLFINKNNFLTDISYGPATWNPEVIDLIDFNVRMKLLLPSEKARSGVANVLFEDCVTKNIISPCKSPYGGSEFYTIPRGRFQVILLYNNGSYLKSDSLRVSSYANIVVDLKGNALHPGDSFSKEWRLLTNHCYRPTSPVPSKSYTFNFGMAGVGNVRGVIRDEVNEPLPGVTIVEKGTVNGTVTDADGLFSIDIGGRTAVLVISFVGYVTKEIEVEVGSQLSVTMEPDITELQEIVVTGYATQSKKEVTGSVSFLEGRVAGVSIVRHNGVEENESISNDDGSPQPNAVEVMREAEQRLYQELLTLKTIRANFSDVGFWEPALFTDRRGQAKFTVTFPDDITRWDAVVFAMNRHLQTGTLRKSIKSYKPLMAELHVPRFLTRGDSANFIGKLLNYTTDKTISGKVKWSGIVDGFEKDVQFDGYFSERLPAYANTTADSITTSYRFTRDDGYFDGEERTLPIVEQGAIRADGNIGVLKNNDEIHLKASGTGAVTLHIFNSQLDVYTADARYLMEYKYLCNEQLASKLIGMLNYKLVMKYEGKEFKYDKDVNKIIQRLLKNQNQEFLWSWWDVSPFASYWMSAHILRALKAAKNAGYHVDLNLDNLVRKVTYKFDHLNDYTSGDIDLVHAIASWNVQADYSKYLARLDSMVWRRERMINRAQSGRYKYSLLKERLLLMEIRQMAKLEYSRDSLLRFKKENMRGEIYFSDNKPAAYWYSDEVTANIIAYRIVKNDSLLKNLITPLQMYFLSSRKNTSWNTYYASNMLMTLLPDLLAEGTTKEKPATIGLTGKVNQQIAKFPYEIQLQKGEELGVVKQSGLPLFYMQYKEERVTKAKTGVEGFGISTSFKEKVLKAGKPTTLTVEVDVKKETNFEYVMIEVPIPGSCSYADKQQMYNGIESHREYFKDRTVIFCENVKPGKYLFQVQLLPRFTGKYFVNPAEVSLMYIPVVNANTDMKMVEVAE